MSVVNRWLAFGCLESFVELVCFSLCASHPYILPFIYSLLHLKQQTIILKCLFTGKTKGNVLVVTAARSSPVPGYPLCHLALSKKVSGQLGWDGDMESKDWGGDCLYSTARYLLGRCLTCFQQCGPVHGWFRIVSCPLAMGSVLD